MTKTVLIAGGGHGGFQAAASLRQDGFDGRVVLIDPEGELPYQRPPLSKGYLAGSVERDSLPFRPEAFFEKNDIKLVTGAVEEIEPASRVVRLSSGERLAYSDLILAVGARPRPCPVEGAELDAVLTLRSLSDADKLRDRVRPGAKLVVVGAGFIGLEVAASAAKLGASVTVVEIAERVMGRAVMPPISAFFAEQQRANGIDLLLGASVKRIIGHRGSVAAVELENGERIDADAVLLAIGVEANASLAAAAGLPVENGIRVNAQLQTAFPSISAIGDCVSFPFAASGETVRLESVQNAVDQARCVAARIAGKPRSYDAVPWFWSDQADLHLQMAGLNRGVDRAVLVGNPEAKTFSVIGFRNGRLVAVESVNRPSDHMAARKLLGLKTNLSPDEAERPSFDLKAFLQTMAQPVKA